LTCFVFAGDARQTVHITADAVGDGVNCCMVAEKDETAEKTKQGMGGIRG